MNMLPLLLVGIVSALPIYAEARGISDWILQPQEVANRSDLIVIARPVQSRDLGPATNTIESEIEDAAEYPDNKANFVPVVTTFEVVTLLKGAVATNRVELFHYRALTWISVDPPSLVCFTNHLSYPTGCLLVNFKDPLYLLFLNERSDSRFRATSGQVDPAFSVKRLVLDSDFDRLTQRYSEGINKKRQPTGARDGVPAAHAP